MAKKKPNIKTISFVDIMKAREKAKTIEAKLRAFKKGVKIRDSMGRVIGPRGEAVSLEVERKAEKDVALAKSRFKSEIEKFRKQIVKKQLGKIESFGKKKFISRRVLRKQPRATLDLRQRNIEPVKQHGFKEMEISNQNFLFN